jgi:hypothetical protein
MFENLFKLKMHFSEAVCSTISANKIIACVNKYNAIKIRPNLFTRRERRGKAGWVAF